MTQSRTDNPQQALILAVETSGRMGSVALAKGPRLLAQREFSAPMKHSAELFPAIEALLSQNRRTPADIDQIYISAGPGSFTGLRIATTLAKTLSLAQNTKIVAVDTLDAIAANATSDPPPALAAIDHLAAVLDAKRSRFFVAAWHRQNDKWTKTLDDCLLRADEFLERFSQTKIALLGEGLVYYADKFAAPNVTILDQKYWTPAAAMVHRLGLQKAATGRCENPLALTPRYIQTPDVIPKKL